jgi:two-component system, cell cycle response regulator
VQQTSKKLYNLYREMVDVLKDFENTGEELLFIAVIKDTLKGLYKTARDFGLVEVWMEIDKVYDIIDRSINLDDKEVLLESFLKCKKILEVNLSEINSIFIYTDNYSEFNDLILSLQYGGFEVFTYSPDDDFISLLSSRNPQAIIIDNNSNNNDGLTLYKHILDDGSLSCIPVIFTGMDKNEERIKALLLGATHYIKKPFNSLELFIKIRNIAEITKNIKAIRNSGILTKKQGEEIAKKVFEKAVMENRNYTIFSIDIDNMIQTVINVGKTIANEIIEDILSILEKYINREEFIYRKSGDKFVAVFLDRDGQSVSEIALVLQDASAALSEKYGVPISFTGGIASISKATGSFSDVLYLSVECLRKAKKDGKARTYIHTESIINDCERSLLFIDSDRIILGILASRYKSKGYEVNSAQSVEEAMDILENKNIDVVVTELFMPGLTGAEIIKGIKKVSQSVKIIVLSAQNSENYISASFKSGADDYISKPFSPVELDLRIQRFVE